MVEVFNVLIIGAGRIGAFFDTPGKDYILTHAHAFKKHPGFNLIGFIDTKIQRAEEASNIWNTRAFLTIDEAFSKHDIDVAVVAVSDEYHYPVLKELLNYPIKLVFSEKPITKTVEQAVEIVDLFKKKGIPLVINYSRRFVPDFLSLKDKISSDTFGGYLSGSGYYGKGTLHNGSHMIDLLMFLLGDIDKTHTVLNVSDHFKDDPTCSAILTFKSDGKFFMQAIDCRNYTLFEIDLLFEKQRVRILESGFKIEYYDVFNSEIFAGYQELKMIESRNTKLIDAIPYASENIYNFLTKGVTCLSLGEEAILSQKVCTSILKNKLEK